MYSSVFLSLCVEIVKYFVDLYTFFTRAIDKPLVARYSIEVKF